MNNLLNIVGFGSFDLRWRVALARWTVSDIFYFSSESCGQGAEERQ